MLAAITIAPQFAVPEGTQNTQSHTLALASLLWPRPDCCSSAAGFPGWPLSSHCSPPWSLFLSHPASSHIMTCSGAVHCSTRETCAGCVLPRILDGRSCSAILAGTCNAQSGWPVYLPVSMEISAACIAFSQAAGTRERMEARTGLEAMSPPAEASPLRATLPLDALLCSLAA